jgi:hypothetical protein
MATFAEIKTDVSAFLQDPSNAAVSSANVGNSVNKAIRYWKYKRFWFNEKVASIILAYNDPVVPLPTDFLVPSITDGAIVIVYSGMRYPLNKLSELDYNAVYLSNGVGQPYAYSKQASAGYQVYFIPDRNYDALLFYLKEYDVLTANDATNDWTDEAQDLITYTAAAYCSRDYRQDLSMYNAFWAQAQTEYTNMLVRTRKENATGSLSVGSIGGYNGFL